MLTIRDELHPEQTCAECDRKVEFLFDNAGTFALNFCHFHARKRAVALIDHAHETMLRDYDQQTARLRLLGKPCKICGIRREEHPTNYGSRDNVCRRWTDDEDTAEAWERGHPRIQLIKDTDHK